MNKILKYITISLALGVAAAFVSCGDWTEPRSIGLDEADIEKDHPELYARYLASLRQYRQADHKAVYAWFDNSEKAPFSRGQHISSVPDSVDVVSLLHPDDLADFEVREMEALRNDKGMKIVYGISYETIRKGYEQMVKEQMAEDENYEAPEFIPYLKERVEVELAPAAKYGYDGIIIGYKGAGTIHMTAEEKAEYKANQEAFLGVITTWLSSNSGKTLALEGNPQNLLDKSILASCEHIILNTLDLRSEGALSVEALMATTDGVPADRFIVAARTVSLDVTDKTTGYYENGGRAVIEAAYWVTEQQSGFTKAGLGIYNIQNDYYNPSATYRYAREAINIMNPAPVK